MLYPLYSCPSETTSAKEPITTPSTHTPPASYNPPLAHGDLWTRYVRREVSSIQREFLEVSLRELVLHRSLLHVVNEARISVKRWSLGLLSTRLHVCQVDLRNLEYRIESDEEVVYTLEEPVVLLIKRRDARHSELVVSMVRINCMRLEVKYQCKHYQLVWYIQPAIKARSE